MVMGLEQLSTLQEEVESALRHINWTRPQWVERIPQPVVFWVTPEFETLLARQAPDMWRFRSLLAEFKLGIESGKSREVELRWRLRHLDLAPRIRMSYLLELAEKHADEEMASRAVSLAVENDLALPLNLVSIEKIRRLVIEKATDKGLRHLKGLTSLTTLYIWSVQVGDAELQYLEGLTALTELYVWSTQVGDAGLQYLKGLTALTNLDLAYTEVTDAGLQYLKGLTALTVLHLGYTAVTDAGLQHLKGLTALTLLNLHGTAVTDPGIDQLRKALPNLMVLR